MILHYLITQYWCWPLVWSSCTCLCVSIVICFSCATSISAALGSEFTDYNANTYGSGDVDHICIYEVGTWSWNLMLQSITVLFAPFFCGIICCDLNNLFGNYA